jgi:hypothetical protein
MQAYPIELPRYMAFSVGPFGHMDAVGFFKVPEYVIARWVLFPVGSCASYTMQ